MGFSSRKNERGFSLVELAIAMAVVGCVVATSLDLFRKYKNDIIRSETEASMSIISAAMGKYVAQNGVYPRPMAQTLKERDPGYGEQAAIASISNTCPPPSGRICRADGLDDDDADSTPDKVLIGSIPFKTLGIPMRATLDSYGRRLTYVVSEELTVDTTGADFKKAVGVKEQTFNNLTGRAYVNPLDPGKAEAMAVVSHGEDGEGAYTVDGKLYVACGTGGTALQDENCDGDGILLKLLVGKQLKTIAADYNDDSLSTTVWQDSNYWSIASSSEVYNKFLGYVGVGTPDGELPGASLDVNGNIKADEIFADKLCTGVDADGNPVNCFETSKIAGTDGMSCRGGMLKGFAQNNVQCGNLNLITGLGLSATACNPGEYMVGISTIGTVICEVPVTP